MVKMLKNVLIGLFALFSFMMAVESETQVVNEKFSFVHLDVDTYLGTKAGLETFYPLLIQNGIIIIDDYSTDDSVGIIEAYIRDNPDAVPTQQYSLES